MMFSKTIRQLRCVVSDDTLRNIINARKRVLLRRYLRKHGFPYNLSQCDEKILRILVRGDKKMNNPEWSEGYNTYYEYRDGAFMGGVDNPYDEDTEPLKWKEWKRGFDDAGWDD